MKGRRVTDINHENDEISLLDLLVVIAESWWLIVGGGLLAGAAAYFVTTSQPDVYTSTAVLAAPPAQINTILADLNVQGDFEVRASGDNTAIAFKAPSRERAEAELTQFLEIATPHLTAPALAPTLPRMEALTKRLGEIEALAGRADAALSQWQAQTEPDETAIASMFQLQQQLQAERFTVQEEARLLALQIVSLPQTMVVVPPGPSERGAGRSPLVMAALAVMGTGFVLILLTFLRHGLRQSADNPESRTKLQRIKNALMFRRTTAN